ncbi:MAG: RDD family protein [Thiotrichales bacterium]
MNSHRTSNPALLPRRLASIFYDAILLIGVLLFASIPIVSLFHLEYGTSRYPLFIIYLYCVSSLYFCWFWTHGGQTLGMKSWKLKLVASNGGDVRWRHAVIRYLLATGWILLLSLATQVPDLIPEHVLNLIFLVTIVVLIIDMSRSPDGRCYFDYLSGTRLLRLINPTTN